MPYSTNKQLPPHIKKLNKRLQDIWRNAFNSAFKQYNGDESKAFAVANSAIKKYKESYSMDFDKQFSEDINKFTKDEKKEKERKNNDYGEDFTDNLDNFLM